MRGQAPALTWRMAAAAMDSTLTPYCWLSWLRQFHLLVAGPLCFNTTTQPGHQTLPHLLGVICWPSCFSPQSTSAMAPHALGLLMLVPFMSWRLCCVHCGTGAMAPPGADRTTPVWPSGVGPLLDQVYCCPCRRHSSKSGSRPCRPMQSGSSKAQDNRFQQIC